MSREILLLRQAVVFVGRFCCYCGEKATHADHILAQSLGGEEVAENLIATCSTCNCKKGNRFLSDESFNKAKFQAFVNAPLVQDLVRHLLAIHSTLVKTDSLIELSFQ